MSTPSYWKPKTSREQAKLSFTEGDWQLAGSSRSISSSITSRTRSSSRSVVGRTSTPSRESSNETLETPVPPPAEVALFNSDITTTSNSTAAPGNGPKPPNSRVILEVKQVKSAFESFCCPKCDNTVEFKLRTVCLASSFSIACTAEVCGWIFHSDSPAPTTMHSACRDGLERSTNYAINVLFVLGFLSVGDGCVESARLLGLLGLPNDTTMESRSFQIIENRIGPAIRQLAEEVMKENLTEEVRMGNLLADFEMWKSSKTDSTSGSVAMPNERKPKICCSYDMGWQQRSSGNKYESLSGHGSMIGAHTRKVVALKIKCKSCHVCECWKKKHGNVLEVMPHNCWKNHEGSSGSMESAALVELVTELYEQSNVVTSLICADDDSSIRADTSWSNADYMANNKTTILPQVPKMHGKNKGEMQDRPDKGKLPGNVPEPKFICDPNHRRKVLTGELIALDKANKDKRMTMTRMDSTRIGKNFGYMARTLKDLPEEQYEERAKAVLEHHFDCHDYCGDWCRRRNEAAAERNASNKYYRCKKKDAKLYAVLAGILGRFTTLERLKEMAHGLDTNMNEALNQIMTWYCPKNKVYAGSASLPNRLSIAVCIHSLGLELFFRRLFVKLGIALDANVEHFLHQKEKHRQRRLSKIRTRNAKVSKNKRKYEQLKKYTLVAKKERHKREGTYRRGMNLDDPYGEGQDDGEECKPPATKKPRGTTNKGQHCPYCGSKGHVTKRSKNCKAPLDGPIRFHKETGLPMIPSEKSAEPILAANQPGEDDDEEEAPVPLQDDADDVEQYDSMPFDAIPPQEDDDEEDLFVDCGTWSEDEDGDVVVIGGTI